MNKQVLDLNALVNDSHTIGVISHINPDGDNLGSTTALVGVLTLLGKDVYFIDNDKVPKDLSFLPYINARKKLSDLPLNLDLLMVLDSSDLGRVGISQKEIDGLSKRIVNIDHHKSNTEYGSLNIVDRMATSTGEVIYTIINKLGWPLNDQIATSLYTAIATDTGSFQYDSVRAKTHLIIADLIEKGADIKRINTCVFQSKSKEKTLLLIEAMQSLTFHFDNQVALVQLTLEDLKKVGAQSSDSEGIVEFIRNIEGVELAIFLKEKEDLVKLSLRSKSYIDCTKIAEKFNGGGHIRASGATIYDSLDGASEKVLLVTKEEYFD